MFSKLSKWFAVTYLTLTFLVFMPLFNWMYCCNHSYSRWMPGGICQACVHALAWPVFILDLKPGPYARLKKSVSLTLGADVLTRGWNPNQLPSPEEWSRVRGKLQEALAEARRIEANALDELYPGLGTHFDLEYRPGLERLTQNPELRLDANMVVGLHLMHLWSSWCHENHDSLKRTL